MREKFDNAFSHCPLVAILRGVGPADVIAIGDVLVGAGFRIIEVPLNSPQPCDSISRLAKHFVGSDVVVGAGTVLNRTSVALVEEAGGSLIISPNCNCEVIAEAVTRGLVSVPGIATATEAFAALDAGAVALKLFPAEGASPPVLKAMRAVLPVGTRVLPVGGIIPDNMHLWRVAGAAGFGLGSALYTPGMTLEAVRINATKFIDAWAAG